MPIGFWGQADPPAEIGGKDMAQIHAPSLEHQQTGAVTRYSGFTLGCELA
jgi:hypothetical protein